ncbi:MAG: right-handed parallel beta-helix repeat-containing protein, partial [Verrucomicrobiota bacterium]
NGGDGIVVTGEGHVIENNNVYAGVRGVVFGEGTLGAEDMTLDNNLLEDQQSHAIDVWQLDGSSLRDNRLVNPGGHGLRMRVGTNNTLVNNVVRDGAADGFFLETSVTRGNLFQRNTLENLPGNGFSLAAAAGVSNYITGNNQRNIAGQWVDLSNDGPTPNDAGDSDDGPNRLQNYPVLSNAVYTPGTELNSDGLVDLDLVLSSDPDQSLYPVIVEFFYLLDGSDFLILRAENARLIETADAGRLIRVTGLQIPGPAPVFPAPDGGFITATAIDAAGNTSEFSPRLEFGTVFDSGFESPDGP